MRHAPWLLIVGDALAILLFAVLGHQSHDLTTAGVSGLLASVKVAAPFLVGWLAVAPWLGAFRPLAWSGPRSAALTVLKAFVPAFLAGVLLRALFLGRFSPATFYLVTAAVILALLLGWRLIYSLLVAPRLIRS